MYSQCCKLQNIFAGIQIQENSVKFRKIQENSTLCQKPPAGPVCIPSVVNCNFFFAGNNCQVLCFTSGGGCLAKGYIYVPHTSTYMYTYLEYIRYTLKYIYYAHFYAGAGTQHRPAFAKSMYTMYYKGVPSQCGFKGPIFSEKRLAIFTGSNRYAVSLS